MDVFSTMIVPANLADLARSLAAGLSEGGVGMFTTALSSTGATPATHYVSTGYIAERFIPCLTDADALYAACQEAGASVTRGQCQALVTGCDVSADEPFARFAELGLALVQEA